MQKTQRTDIDQINQKTYVLKQIQEEVISCRKCARLVAWREQVARTRRRAYQDQTYWGRPVPGFGDPLARVLVVGLAPAAHGGNRTGRVFTGDSSGDFLFRALYVHGFSNQPIARQRGDGLVLQDAYITAVCRCVPPANKPTSEEIANCLPYLERERQLLHNLEGIVALGKIAFDNVIRLHRQRGDSLPRLNFAHGAFYRLGDGLPWLLASYHPSRQNTQTGRLTVTMFDEIWGKTRQLLSTPRGE